MTRVLLDTAVFLHAVGDEHPLRDPCRSLVGALRDGAVAGEASVELVHEYAHVRLRRSGDRARAAAEAQAIRHLVSVHPVEVDDLDRALRLFADHPVGGRDAVHAATALNRGIDVVVSPDRGFDHVPGLERLPPNETASRLR